MALRACTSLLSGQRQQTKTNHLHQAKHGQMKKGNIMQRKCKGKSRLNLRAMASHALQRLYVTPRMAAERGT